MDPFTMAELLLPGVSLTPGQLAQLRALNTKYFTELAMRRDVAELEAMIVRDIREMLTPEQQTVLDRNCRTLRPR